jgi:hypothetical protein
MGEPIHPLIEELPIIDDAVADLGRLRPVPLQRLVRNAAIFGRFGQRQTAFRDVGGERHRFVSSPGIIA